MTGVDWATIKDNIMVARAPKGEGKLVVLQDEDWRKIYNFIGKMIDMRQQIREFLE